MEKVKCSLCGGKADFYDAYMCIRSLEENRTKPGNGGPTLTTSREETPYKAELLGVCRNCAERNRMKGGKPSTGFLVLLFVFAALCIGLIFYIYPQTNGDVGSMIGVSIIFGGLAALFIGLAVSHIRKAERSLQITPNEYFEKNKGYLASLRMPASMRENGRTYRLFYIRLNNGGNEYRGGDKVIESVKKFGESISALTPEEKIAAAEKQIERLHNGAE